MSGRWRLMHRPKCILFLLGVSTFVMAAHARGPATSVRENTDHAGIPDGMFGYLRRFCTGTYS